MDQGRLLDDFAQVRRQVTTLCFHNRFSAAQMLLVGSGQSPRDVPGLWEHIARSAAQAGHDPIAHEVRKHIWAAGGAHERLTLDEAAFFFKQGDIQNTIFVLEGYFGEMPAHPDALELLTRAYLAEARGQQAGTRLRTSHEAALRLTDGITPQTAQHAMAAVDLLRYSGEIDKAMTLNDLAMTQFADDVRFLMRRAMMHEQKGRFEAAADVWRSVSATSERYHTEALVRLHSLYQRLERYDDAEPVAARLFGSELAIEQRIALALQIGQRGLMLAMVRAIASSRHASEALSFAQGKAIGNSLLDHGELGLLAWLRRRRMPLGDRVKRVLDQCAFGAPDGLEMPESFDAASALRSPDALLPLQDFAELTPKPPGWPGQRKDPGRILLVNASLKAGGAERQFVALAKALLDTGIEPESLDVALFSLQADRAMDAFLPDLQALGITIYDLSAQPVANPTLPPNVARVLDALPYALRQDVVPLWHLLSRLQPDVVHGWQDRSAAACAVAGVLLETKRLVLSMRNMSPQTRRDGQLVALRGLMASVAQLGHVTLTANSSAGQKDYDTWLGLAPDVVEPLNNIVDLDRFAQTKAAYVARRKDKAISVGGVFRLALNKRPLLWVQTVATLRDRLDVPLRPVLFGDGPMLEQVRSEAARLGMADLRIETGETDPTRIYSQMDTLLLMSRVEGVPNVLLEAQACGLPVAACDVGGVSQALQRRGAAGALLLPDDVTAEAAADQVAKWLPKARAAKVDPRVGFIRTRYSADAVMARLLKTYCGVET